jgi:hypothetical protein
MASDERWGDADDAWERERNKPGIRDYWQNTTPCGFFKRGWDAARAAAPAGDELRRALANWAEWLRGPGLPPDRLADPVKVLLLASGLIASDEGGVLRWLDPTPAAPGPDELEAAVIKIVNDEWKAPEVKAEMVREAFARARRKEARDA